MGKTVRGAFVIWAMLLLELAAFFAWYENWDGPLTPEEIDTYFARAAGQASGNHTDPEALRRFLEADDGRSFLMLNLVKLAPEPVPHPETGVPTRAADLLDGYTARFLTALAWRAGHPVLAGQQVGAHVDSWGDLPDPGWSVIGLMRYRSRRDMMELVTDPQFSSGHAFKIAAIEQTASFPTQVLASFSAGPRLLVPLISILIAAFAHMHLLRRALRQARAGKD